MFVYTNVCKLQISVEDITMSIDNPSNFSNPRLVTES